MKHLSRRAGRIVRQAKAIARQQVCGYVGTEHLLLAIMREDGGIAADLLRDQCVTEERVRAEMKECEPSHMDESRVPGSLAGMSHFRDALSNASKEARRQGEWEICSIHLLQGLLSVEESAAYKALRVFGVTADFVHQCFEREMAIG